MISLLQLTIEELSILDESLSMDDSDKGKAKCIQYIPGNYIFGLHNITKKQVASPSPTKLISLHFLQTHSTSKMVFPTRR